ncbi:MAG: VTC domain-containing protein [Exiguobacterium sp.]|nr:VTC domain-containing protein [Exiguobacterium sp.]
MATAGDTFQRKEKKYLISSGQCKAIKEGLTSHMRLDDYGATRIDSLYLDSFDHNLICKSLEKPLYKEKLRVRSYGAFSEADAVYVEIKKKFKGIVYKRRVRMSAEGARAYYTHQMTYE